MVRPDIEALKLHAPSDAYEALANYTLTVEAEQANAKVLISDLEAELKLAKAYVKKLEAEKIAVREKTSEIFAYTVVASSMARGHADLSDIQDLEKRIMELLKAT